MVEVAREDLQWLATDVESIDIDVSDARPDWEDADPAGIESLRTAFVEAFNARDLDAVLELVTDDVEYGDAGVEGRAALADELVAIWERSPGVLLTRAYMDSDPCAVAWRPDERGAWVRAALVCFDVEGDLITLIEVPDDVEALETVVTEDPTGEQADEWLDWSEYDGQQPEVAP